MLTSMLPPSSFAPFLAYHAGFIGESYFLPPLKTTVLIKNACVGVYSFLGKFRIYRDNV